MFTARRVFSLLGWLATLCAPVCADVWNFNGKDLRSSQGRSLRSLPGTLLEYTGPGGNKALRVTTVAGGVAQPRFAGFVNDVDYRDFHVSVDLTAFPLPPEQNEVYVLWARMTDDWNGYILWLVNKTDLDPTDQSEPGRATFGMQRLKNAKTFSQGNASPEASFNIRVPGWAPGKRYRMTFEGRGEQLFGTLHELQPSGTPSTQPLLRQTFRIDSPGAGPNSGKTGFTIKGRSVTVDNYVAKPLAQAPPIFPEIKVNGTIGRVDVRDRMTLRVSLGVRRATSGERAPRTRVYVFGHNRWPTGDIPNGSPVTNYCLEASPQCPVSFESGPAPVPVYEGPLKEIPEMELPASPVRVPAGGDYLTSMQVALDEDGDGVFSTPWTNVVEAMATNPHFSHVGRGRQFLGGAEVGPRLGGGARKKEVGLSQYLGSIRPPERRRGLRRAHGSALL